MSGTWTTKDGRNLLIAWMDSSHLINTLNMIARTSDLSRASLEAAGTPTSKLSNLVNEIKARRLWNWSGAGKAQLITQDVPREDFKTLCMLRAVLDVKPKNVEEIIELFHRNPASYTEHVMSCADPKWIPVVAKFAEYRLHPVEQWR